MPLLLRVISHINIISIYANNVTLNSIDFIVGRKMERKRDFKINIDGFEWISFIILSNGR